MLALALPDGFVQWLQARMESERVAEAEDEFVPLTPDQMNRLWGVM